MTMNILTTLDASHCPRILVLGHSEAAITLYQRLQRQTSPEHVLVLSRYPVDQPFDLVLDVDRQEPLSLRAITTIPAMSPCPGCSAWA